jgi:Uma2 family endonuclease
MGLPLPRTTLADYLAWEDTQAEKHEFFEGEIFAMVGARRVHGIVGLNLAAALKTHLRGTSCGVFVESMKVQLSENSVVYPDVFVTCDPADLKTELLFRAPSLVVEVLSEGTEKYDRGAKFAAYRQLASLREYVLVDPDSRSLEVYRRNAAGNFELFDQTGQPTLELSSIGLTLPMAEVYEGIEATEAASPHSPETDPPS